MVRRTKDYTLPSVLCKTVPPDFRKLSAPSCSCVLTGENRVAYGVAVLFACLKTPKSVRRRRQLSIRAVARVCLFLSADGSFEFRVLPKPAA